MPASVAVLIFFFIVKTLVSISSCDFALASVFVVSGKNPFAFASSSRPPKKADWMVVERKEDTGSPLAMTEEAAHNHHVVAKCLDPEVSFSSSVI